MSNNQNATSDNVANTNKSKASRKNNNPDGRPPETIPTKDEIGELELTEHPLADRAWRLYVKEMDVREVGRVLKIHHTTAWRLIAARTKELREVTSPEHRAACVGVLLERHRELYNRVMDIIDVLEPDNRSLPALFACAIKINQDVGKIHGVNGELEMQVMVDHNRLEEVARRLSLVGVHSRAQEKNMKRAEATVLDMAGVAPRKTLKEAVTEVINE